MMRRAVSTPCVTFRSGEGHATLRALPEEVPVALTYNGTTQAVMMATPADLEDFALGFSLTEGLIEESGEIERLEIVDLDQGIEARIWLDAPRAAAFAARRRSMAGPVGCGLCGIDSLEQAVRPVARVADGPLRLAPSDILAACEGLRAAQPLHDQTRATHAAGFYCPGSGIVMAREDVGRHNALDKLVGALSHQGYDPAVGAIVLTSRVSIEMVQKAAVAGAPLMIAASAPTAHALRLADSAGITLAALVRDGGFTVFSHPERIAPGGSLNVA